MYFLKIICVLLNVIKSIILLKKVPLKEKLFFLNSGLKKQNEFINKCRSEKNLVKEKQDKDNSANLKLADINNCTKTEDSVNLSKLFHNEEEYSLKQLKKLIINTKFLTYKDPLNFHGIQFKTPSKQQHHAAQIPPLGYYNVSDSGIAKNIPSFKLKYPNNSPKINNENVNNTQSSFMSAEKSSPKERQQNKILFPKIKCKQSQIEEQKELLKNRFSPTPLKNFENFPAQQFESQLNQYKKMAKEVALNLSKWGKKQEL